MGQWVADVLGDDFEQLTLELGEDPDGEGLIVATLVRPVRARDLADDVVLYLHGYTDYFFQTDLAQSFADRNIAFYGLDLRKCGRSLREGQTRHYVSDLSLYDDELDRALEVIDAEHPGAKILVMGHSTGGLIATLWLGHRHRTERGLRQSNVAGLILNSPWFDVAGPEPALKVVAGFLRAVARFNPTWRLPLPANDAYGSSLHRSTGGEWDYDLDWKPLTGTPIRASWITAIRAGHQQIRQGAVDVKVPTLLLRSDRSAVLRARDARVAESADIVLDVTKMARQAQLIGGELRDAPIAGARHDVFLSSPEPARRALSALDEWLGDLIG